jgi:hypothetical protein
LARHRRPFVHRRFRLLQRSDGSSPIVRLSLFIIRLRSDGGARQSQKNLHESCALDKQSSVRELLRAVFAHGFSEIDGCAQLDTTFARRVDMAASC